MRNAQNHDLWVNTALLNDWKLIHCKKMSKMMIIAFNVPVKKENMSLADNASDIFRSPLVVRRNTNSLKYTGNFLQKVGLSLEPLNSCGKRVINPRSKMDHSFFFHVTFKAARKQRGLAVNMPNLKRFKDH